MQRAWTLALLVVVPLAAGSAAARHQPSPVEPDPATITPAMILAGRAIFHGKGLCFGCHGAQLEGTQVAPTLKPHAWRDAKNGDIHEIFRIVTHGVPGTLMVPFPGGISRAEAVNVVSYVWSVSQGREKP